MCHLNIAFRDIALDTEDNIWLIDWGLLGAYPLCFEEAALKLQSQFADLAETVLNRIEKYKKETALIIIL